MRRHDCVVVRLGETVIGHGTVLRAYPDNTLAITWKTFFGTELAQEGRVPPLRIIGEKERFSRVPKENCEIVIPIPPTDPVERVDRRIGALDRRKKVGV